MGTSNFGRLQLCNNYWSFGLDAEEEGEFIYEDTIQNVFFELKNKDYFLETNKKYQGDNQIIGYFNVPFYNREKNWYDDDCIGWDENKYFIIVEGGYYSGARFDIVESDYYNEDYINKTYEKKRDKIIKDIEKVFLKYCTPLVRVATFSNGETIYEIKH